MAWDYAAQIHALTGFDADDTSSITESGETFSVMATQWLTDAAKEIINTLPINLLKQCSAMHPVASSTDDTITPFTSAVVGSETETLNTGKVLGVFAGSYEAREIPSNLKYKSSDSDSIEYASSTDPVFYVERNKLNVLPAGLSITYEEVQYPSVAYTDGASGIDSFPDEAEYLVPMRASITALEYVMATEEDVELYIPILTNLRNDYLQGINALKTSSLMPPQTKKE